MNRVFAALLCWLLVGCASSAPSVDSLRGVPDPIAAAALAAGPPPAGRARLLIVAGTWDNAYPRTFVVPRERWVRGDVVVDGVHIGFLQSGQGLVLDLPPQTYTLHWQLRDPLTDSVITLANVRAVRIPVALAAGQTTAFTADVIDRQRVRMRPSLVDPPARFSSEGTIDSVLTPVADPQSLLARGLSVLSPQPARLAEVRGASLAGR
jgi:hypothetical protein